MIPVEIWRDSSSQQTSMLRVATLVFGLQLLSLIHGDIASNNLPEVGERGVVEDAVKIALNRLRALESINPLYLPEVDTIVDSGHTYLKVELNNGTLTGLPIFEDTVLFRGNLITGGVLEVTLFFPELTILGPHYGVNGLIGGVLNMNADGPFEIIFGKVTLPLTADLKIIGGLGISNTVADAKFEDFSFRMDNFLGDLSDEFNQMMTDVGPDIIALYSVQINNLLATYIERVVNNLLPLVGGGAMDTLLADSEIEKRVTDLMSTLVKHAESKITTHE